MFPKRSRLLGAGLLCLTLTGYSVALASLPVAWELRMGPSLTGVSGELADSLDRTNGGFDGGVSFHWPRSASLFGVQGELLFASRSRSFEDMVSTGLGAGLRLRRSLRVIYAQIPLLARASSRRGRFRPYAVAGPYVAWRLSSRINEGHYVGDEPVNPADVRARDAGAIVGVGSELVTGAGRMAVELRFGLGLVDVLEDRVGIEGTYRVLTLLLAFTPSD